MARKDFDNYYQQIYKQFHQLNEVFNDLAKEVAEGMVEPERQTELEKTIEQIKTSYQTLSYIKYLLDKPKRKSKHQAYDKRSKKLLNISKGNQQKDLIERNADILNNLSK